MLLCAAWCESLFSVIVCPLILLEAEDFFMVSVDSHLDLDRNVYTCILIWYNILTTVSVAFSANKHQNVQIIFYTTAEKLQLEN